MPRPQQACIHQIICAKGDCKHYNRKCGPYYFGMLLNPTTGRNAVRNLRTEALFKTVKAPICTRDVAFHELSSRRGTRNSLESWIPNIPWTADRAQTYALGLRFLGYCSDNPDH